MAAEDQDEQHREKLRQVHAQGGADMVVAFIQGTPDPALRRKLYSLSRQILPDRKTSGRSFDEIVRMARSGIAECLRQAELARARVDITEAQECIDAANKLSYNLAADLAACWPGDESPRERRHFESGLRAAYDCVVWRQELNKPPDRRAMAHWVAGMHHLSLGNGIEALCAFEAAFGLALEAASTEGTEEEKPEAFVKPNGDFGVNLYFGYAGIARQRLGDEAGTRQLEQACAAFEETVRHPKDAEAAEDAVFGLEQLRYVERKYPALSGTAS